MAAFDPYHKWLGISPDEQPPHHYRLLGIRAFEDDPDVISAAADRQMAFIRQHANGPHGRDSQKLLNELAGARLCLLSESKREQYDAELRSELGTSARWDIRAALAGLPPAVMIALAAAICLVVIVGAFAFWPAKPPRPTLADQTKSSGDGKADVPEPSTGASRSAEMLNDPTNAATAGSTPGAKSVAPRIEPIAASPATSANPNAQPAGRPLDFAFERAFAQKLIDKKIHALSLKGESQGMGGNLRDLPEWPFYIESLEFRAPQSVFTEDDLTDAQRLHGVHTVTVDGNALTDGGFARIAQAGTLKRVMVTGDSHLTGAAFRNCPQLELLEFVGTMDTASLEVIAMNSPRLSQLRLRGLQSEAADFAAISRMQNLVRLDLEDCKINAETVAALSRIPRLGWIEFTRGEFVGMGPRTLPQFPALDSLCFRNAVIRKGVVGWFATSFPQLKRFRAHESVLDPSDWSELRRMTSLHTFEGFKSSIPDEAVQYLPTTLGEINLFGTSISGSGFQKLHDVFPNLGYLNLDTTQATDENLIHILKLTPNLRTLSIPNTRVGPAGFRQIAQLTELEVLAMHGVSEPVECLRELQNGVPKLTRIFCMFPPDAVAAFQKTHPNCKLQ